MTGRIKSLVDQIVVERDFKRQCNILEELLGEVIPYALQDYQSCREVIQATLGQLERIPSVCIPYMFTIVRDQIEKIQVKKGVPAYLEYVNKDWGDDIKPLLDRVAPLVGKEVRSFDLHTEVAEVLTLDERRAFASFVTDYIQMQGLKSQWSNDIFQSSLLFCNILYPICKKEGMVPLLFHVYGNIIDRLNTSGNSQDARDTAEGILILGYNEKCEAEAYLCASRAYTGAHNVIGGLLFFVITLRLVVERGQINEKFAFDIYWLFLKICRAYSIFPKKDIEKVTKRLDSDITDVRDKLSFYHTLFSARLMAGKGYDSLVSDIEDFLSLNREAYYRNLEHGSMPWISLIVSIQEVLPNADYSGLLPYVTAARQVACKEGNEMLFDLFEGKNLAKHLKVVQYKLQNTRSRSDYAMDNHMAMIISKKLLCQAYEKGNTEDFLLAMSPKTDFSIVLPIKDVKGIYKRFEIADVDGDELSSVYSDSKSVGDLMALEDRDALYWMGRGNHEFLVMSLFDNRFEKSGEIRVSRTNIKDTVDNKIAVLRYERATKEPGKPVYVKSDAELEDEGNELAETLKAFSVSVPESSERLIFIKDIEIASYPHQLFIDGLKGGFVSANRPCCNALSTEVLFKTNTINALPAGFTKSFWIPFGSEELTFDMIYSKLEDVIKEHGITIQNTLSVDNPLTADMTLLCAHGGFDISTSEVFYVNEQPILDTIPCIGAGKVAVLFICYSGTISRSFYDNAMHTLVKKLILKGYSSIVAPMWSLPVDIITTWLSTFLGAMEQGDYIIDAVFKANMAVKAEFVAPSAWACLHLFGNPYTRISDRERIVIE